MSYRDNCRICGESYDEDNLLTCERCGTSYCYRCSGTKVSLCARCAPSPGATSDSATTTPVGTEGNPSLDSTREPAGPGVSDVDAETTTPRVTGNNSPVASTPEPTGDASHRKREPGVPPNTRLLAEGHRTWITDWGVFFMSVCLAVVGAVMWYRTEQVMGLFVACFFVLASAGAALRVIPHYRRLATPCAVTVAGGVPIRPLRGKVVFVAAICIAVGGAFCAIDGGRLPLAWLVGTPLLLSGLALLLGAWLRKLPAGYLQFDPAGLTVGHRSFRYLIPWSSISSISMAGFHGQPLVLIGLHDPAALIADPPARSAQLQKLFARSQALSGAPVMIFTSLFNIAPEVVAKAIERYVSAPQTRSELGRRLEGCG